jgi:hypothetical protein
LPIFAISSNPGFHWLLGFAVFFAAFEITRNLATQGRSVSEYAVTYISQEGDTSRKLRRHTPGAVYTLTLVAGGAAAGLAYEVVTRPWDAARKAVRLEQISSPDMAKKQFPIFRSLKRIVESEGWIGFFRDIDYVPAKALDRSDRWKQRLLTMSRVLARVGPWGIGFLVWESLS